LAVGLSACPQVAKTAADGAAAIKCVADDWGKPVTQVASDCFQQEEQLAIDAVADFEVVLQKSGATPTTAYLTDARVQQKVLLKMKAGGKTSLSNTDEQYVIARLAH
jgi:hypothetical protein